MNLQTQIRVSSSNTKTCMYSITLLGRIPSKKNSKVFTYRGNRPLLISSQSYVDWHNEQMWMLKKHKVHFDKCRMILTFFFPDNRKTDLTNKTESIMDLLVDSGILLDDNWTVVNELTLISKGVDKKNPRVEIVFV